ncbi:MAG TPA: NAD(P)/FAD-dependent oxidoreductase [Firmicutes bacterium]|nr:NAD(P)/FAD-dependent oxidoreductase [Bacillota bacterium]
MRAVIVGNSAAGLAAAQAFRAAAPAAELLLVCGDAGPAYSRVLTSYYLAGRIPREGLFLVDDHFYRQQQIQTLFGRQAAGLAPDEDVLLLEDGSRLEFDRLLVATGATPQRLSAPGAEGEGVFTLRTREDAEAIRRAARGAERAVIAGGGMVALKAAEALHELGLAVTLVVSSPQLLSQMLDPVTADLVRRRLEAWGLAVLLGEDVAEIVREGGRLEVRTSGGRELPCDLVVAGKGVRPNVGWLAGSGVAVNRGVVVDAFLQTSRPGVWAAGDVAETWDLARGERRVNALWGNAVEQGRVAGLNLASPDGQAAAYPGSLAENSLHWGDLSVISVGQVNPPAGDSRYRIHERREGDRFYRRLVFREGRLVGAVLFGDVRGAGILRALIQASASSPRSLEPSDGLAAELLAPGLAYGRLYRRLVPGLAKPAPLLPVDSWQ